MLLSKDEANAVHRTLPAVPNLGHQKSFWNYQVWRRPEEKHLIMWALEWSDQGGRSMGTHGRLRWDPAGPRWAVEYHGPHSEWSCVGHEALLLDAAEALLRHLRTINAEDRLRGGA